MLSTGDTVYCLSYKQVKNKGIYHVNYNNASGTFYNDKNFNQSGRYNK